VVTLFILMSSFSQAGKSRAESGEKLFRSLRLFVDDSGEVLERVERAIRAATGESPEEWEVSLFRHGLQSLPPSGNLHGGVLPHHADVSIRSAGREQLLLVLRRLADPGRSALALLYAGVPAEQIREILNVPSTELNGLLKGARSAFGTGISGSLV